jgi:cobalt-zinc-cadmium efflux system protein
MAHHHDHHHHEAPSMDHLNRIFFIGIGLNALFTIIEFVVGFSVDSLALISDASHNLSDVASLIISLIGMRLAQKAASLSYTYGYKKASILASLINAIFLIVVVIGIFSEAIERLSAPPVVEGTAIVIVAGIGVLINAVSALLFFKGQKDDINIKGAFLHLMVDALVSVGVVASGFLIRLTGWSLIDPMISMLIGGVIFISTWGLLKESLRLVIDAVPKSISVDDIVAKIATVPGVKSVHHVHVWALSSNENALSAHVVVESESDEKWQLIRAEIHHLLQHEKIGHVTLEHELSEGCEDLDCDHTA